MNATTFWSRVSIGSPPAHVPAIGPCWEWQGPRYSMFGYGQTNEGGRPVGVHRFVWRLVVGPIPDRLWVLHACDNKVCVRPSHLFLGTAKDNKRDWVRKYRALGKTPDRARRRCA